MAVPARLVAADASPGIIFATCKGPSVHALPWSSALPLALKLALVRWDGRGRVVGYGPLGSGRGYAALSARLDLRPGLVKYVGASEKGSGGAIVRLTGDMGVWRKLSVRFGSPTSRSP